MGLGQSEHQVHLQLAVAETFAACVDAGNECGQVVEQCPSLGSLVVRIMYGLADPMYGHLVYIQQVELRIAVSPSGGGSVVTVSSDTDDIWDGSGRKGPDKFFNALETRIPGFHVTPDG